MLHVSNELPEQDYADYGNNQAVPKSAITAEIAAKIADLVDSAPATLDTLNELAAALADDPNFATTITTALAGKSDIGHTHVDNAMEISDIQSQGTAAQSLASGDWRDLRLGAIQYNDIASASMPSNTEASLPTGTYRLHLSGNLVPNGMPTGCFAGVRLWDSTSSALIRRLPTVNPSGAVDYYGLGHENGNAFNITTRFTLSQTTIVKVQIYPTTALLSGKSLNIASVGDECFTHLLIEKLA